MNTLDERMHKYLQSFGHGKTVSKKHLALQSAAKGYTPEYITRSFVLLETRPDIGVFMKDGERVFAWYSLTPEELETHKKQLAFWNSL